MNVVSFLREERNDSRRRTAVPLQQSIQVSHVVTVSAPPTFRPSVRPVRISSNWTTVSSEGLAFEPETYAGAAGVVVPSAQAAAAAARAAVGEQQQQSAHRNIR